MMVNNNIKTPYASPEARVFCLSVRRAILEGSPMYNSTGSDTEETDYEELP